MCVLFDPTFYWSVVGTMAGLAIIVFFALQRITAGYGMMYDKRWGPTISNRAGWTLMEAPAFICMLILWLLSSRVGQIAPVVMTAFFLIHYFQRSFVFPMLLRGKNKMPLIIILLGIIFNTINAYMIGGWLFYICPTDTYPVNWLWSPLFILGSIVFFAGMGINMRSDYIVRHLRKPGDTRHYIPRGGMYRYVTCANYFGEFTEWVGFAILSWSIPGAVFALWTFANLAPRAVSIHRRYLREFGDEYASLNRKYILPFIY